MNPEDEQLNPADEGRLEPGVGRPVPERKERPILFSAPMVRSLLDGSKTQTRRVIKPAKPSDDIRTPCPYGRPGDLLWVREAFRLCAEADCTKPRDTDAAYRVWYEADAPHQPGFGKLRPSMFMPRWASRLVLELTHVRAERLHETSRGDAMAEGCPFPNMAQGDDPRQWYSELWDQINGAGAWAANPWVWVVEFRKTLNR